jgi:hypothetical protein
MHPGWKGSANWHPRRRSAAKQSFWIRAAAAAEALERRYLAPIRGFSASRTRNESEGGAPVLSRQAVSGAAATPSWRRRLKQERRSHSSLIRECCSSGLRPDHGPHASPTASAAVEEGGSRRHPSFCAVEGDRGARAGEGPRRHKSSNAKDPGMLSASPPARIRDWHAPSSFLPRSLSWPPLCCARIGTARRKGRASSPGSRKDSSTEGNKAKT